jgi:prolyl-tRNA synthetase
VMTAAESLEKELEAEGIEVLWDDRANASAGEKFADADLIGIPLRLVISPKTLAEGAVEWKLRNDGGSRLVKMEDAVEETVSFVKEA